MLTSSFPAEPADETCGYIRDFARAVSFEFEVTILAPPDANACEWIDDDFTLVRSRSLLPERVDPFQSSKDFNNLTSQGFVAKAGSIISLAGFIKDALRLARRADVICSHWLAPSGLAGAIASRLFGKPHVVIEHSGALHLLARMTGGRRVARFIARNSDRVVVVSRDLKDKLAALCPESKDKIEVAPMGISAGIQLTEQADSMTAKAAHVLSERRTVLFVGRLSEVKGCDVLIRAAKRIEGARLIIAGDGDERRGLETLARTLSVDAAFLGRVESAERDNLFSSCDAVVVPSRVLKCGRTEGTPVVSLEAMAAGCVVVASRVGGLAEIISDGHNGLLFDSEDASALAEQITRALSDDELRQKISINARRTAAQFAWPIVGARFNRIIKAAMKKEDAINYDKASCRASAD